MSRRHSATAFSVETFHAISANTIRGSLSVSKYHSIPKTHRGDRPARGCEGWTKLKKLGFSDSRLGKLMNVDEESSTQSPPQT
jgi:hypothetical protein